MRGGDFAPGRFLTYIPGKGGEVTHLFIREYPA